MNRGHDLTWQEGKTGAFLKMELKLELNVDA